MWASSFDGMISNDLLDGRLKLSIGYLKLRDAHTEPLHHAPQRFVYGFG